MPVVVGADDAAILAAAIEVTDDFGLVLDGDELVDAAGARWPLDTLTALVSARCAAYDGVPVDLPHSSLGRARLAFDESKVVREHGRFGFKDDTEKEKPEREFHGPVTEPVKVLADGKAAYLDAHGLQSSGTDFSTVTVDPQMQRDLADAFDAMPMDDPASHEAYDQLGAQTAEQFDYLTNELGITVSVVDHDPYANVAEMVADVRDNGHLAVLATEATGSHAYLSDETNDQFRAVHDAFGHAAIGRGFDRDGEEAAFQSHAEMFTGSAVRALASETRGQNAVLITRGEFPPQKVGLLPEGAELVSANRAAITAAPIPPGDADRDNLYDETHVHHVSIGRRLPARRTVSASVRAAIERVRARLADFDESKIVRGPGGRFGEKDKDEDPAVQEPTTGASNDMHDVVAIEGWEGAGPQQDTIATVGGLKVDEARQAGVFTNPATGQPLIMGYRADNVEAKMVVAHDIAGRMSSVSTEELVATAFHDNFLTNDLANITGFQFDSSAGGWRPVTDPLDTRGSPYQAGTVWKDNPEFDRIARESSVGMMVHEWAGTSNDNSITSLAIQDTVEAHFGLEGTYPWDQESGYVRDAVDAVRSEHGDTLDAFVTAQYEGTQEFLREAGVDELDLARGMNIDPEHSNTMGDDISVDMRPLSSFSTDASTAASFGSDVQLYGRVPADRVFATPYTGVGCLNEYEVVVLGGGDQHFGITGAEKDPADTYDQAHEAFAAFVEGTPYEFDNIELNEDYWSADAIEPYTGDTVTLDVMVDSDSVGQSEPLWSTSEIDYMKQADIITLNAATEDLPVSAYAVAGNVNFNDDMHAGSTSLTVAYDAANPDKNSNGMDADRAQVGVDAIVLGHMDAVAMGAVVEATPGMENVGDMRAYTTWPTGVQALNPELDKFDARSTLGVLQNPEVTGGLITAGGYSTSLMAHSTYDKADDTVTVTVTKGGDSVAHPSEPVATTSYTMSEFKADPAATEASVAQSVAMQVEYPQQALDLTTPPADNEPGNDPSKVEPF